MSAFGIFALILTTAYIIYFAVVITKDVIESRKKATGTESTEEFEIPEQEEAVVVQETLGGFSIGEVESVLEEGHVPLPDEEEPSSEEPLPEPTTTEEIAKNIDAQAESIEDTQFFNNELYDDDMLAAISMNNGTIDGGQILIDRIETPAAGESSETSAEDESRDML